MENDVTIVLLAAGASTRMRGTDKLLELVNGAPLLGVLAGRCARVAPTRVVLGTDQPKRRKTLRDLDVEIVEVTEPDGMAASLRRGIAGLHCAGVLVVLADMPDLKSDDFSIIVKAFKYNPNVIFRGSDIHKKPGHPVLFPATLFPEITQLSGDNGARAILKRHADLVHLVPLTGNRAFTDLDTLEDWANWRKSQT